MTGKERLTRLFNREEIDRVPIWLLFPYHPISCYVDVYKLDSYRRVVAAADRYADVFDRREFDTGFCLSVSPDISHNYQRVNQGNRVIIRHTVCYQDVQLTEEKIIDEHGQLTTTEKLVKNINDLEKILNMPYLPPEPETTAFFQEEEELGDRGLMMVDIGDPLGILYHLCEIEQFALWSVLERSVLQGFLEEMYMRYLDLYRYLLVRGVGPVYFIVGAEFAGPPVVSPADFNELSGRYVKGIVDLIRSYGMKSIVHYHGNLKLILEGIKHIKPDGLHTIEAPPVGDCTIREARKALGDIILIGNIQYDDLARRSGGEIEEMVREAVDQGRDGRFILSPTAGPYEREITIEMQENYIRFMEAGFRSGLY